jgi:hypothetical protein
MLLPLSSSDLSLWFAVMAVIYLITSELLYSLPDYSGRIAIDKGLLRLVAVRCGLAFLVTVVLRIMGMI